MSAKIKVEILVAPDCASRQPTEELIAKILAETAVTATVKTTVIEDARQARATGFLGSPSVQVNGLDVEPEARTRKEYGLG